MDLNGWAIIVVAAFAAVGWAYAAGQHHANKRPINVHQEQHNHAAPVSVTTASGDTLGPKLIVGLFGLLIVGAVAMFAVSAVGNFANAFGRDLDRIFNRPQTMPQTVPDTQPAPQVYVPPQVTYPQAVPTAHPAEVQVKWYHIVIPVLVIAVTVLWGSIASMYMRRRPIKRKNVITPPGKPAYTHPAFDAAAKNVGAHRISQ